MKSPEFFDPSIPTVKFSESEREEFRKAGMTDEQIDAKQDQANNKLAKDLLNKEMRDAA